MDLTHIITHMNDYHKEDLEGLVRKFAIPKVNGEIKEISLKNVDMDGLDIFYDSKILRVDFPSRSEIKDLKQSIINLCKDTSKTHDIDAIKQEIKEFQNSFKTIVLASVDKDGHAVASYSPIINVDNNFYIYISEVAEHYDAFKHNPDKIEAMFLEDESHAKSMILRKRLRYKTSAVFIKRDSDEFKNVIKELNNKMDGSGGIQTIIKMLDFHLIKIIFLKGRYVRGFGGAYDIDAKGEVTFAGAKGNPHKLKR